jgi:hypothetical protein
VAVRKELTTHLVLEYQTKDTQVVLEYHPQVGQVVVVVVLVVLERKHKQMEQGSKEMVG